MAEKVKGFEGLEPKIELEMADTGAGMSSANPGRELPEGTKVVLDTKKYLWALTGHIALHIPISRLEELDGLVDMWYDWQCNIEKEFADELDAIYNRPQAPREERQAGSQEPNVKGLRGVIFGIGTQKGVHVMSKYPNIMDMTYNELLALKKELLQLPDKVAENIAESATRRVRAARQRR